MRLTGTAMAAAVAMAALAAPASAALVYGNATETANRFNANVAPGNTDTIMWMNAFVDSTNGGTLNLTSIDWGVRRLVDTSGNLVTVDVELFVAEMTFDGTNFGLGTVTNLGTQSLGGGVASVTQIVTANTAASIALETVSNPGLGGLFVGLRFAGANAQNNANGWRVVNAPGVGASINAFWMSNWTNSSSGFEGAFAFGNPPGSAPSRFFTNINGDVVPSPATLALLGAAGLVARRRRA